MRSHRQGFTLVELLVVISIIALLSTIVLAALNSARNKAQNAKRQSDIRQYVNALEFYYDDNGGYPNPNPDINTTQNFCLGPNLPSNPCRAYGFSSVLTQALQKYLPSLPMDKAISGASLTGYIYSCDSLDATRCKDFFIYWFQEGVGSKCIGGATATDIPASNLTRCGIIRP